MVMVAAAVVSTTRKTDGSSSRPAIRKTQPARTTKAAFHASAL
jgi:hypothetical protein